MKLEVSVPSAAFVFDKKLMRKVLRQAGREVANAAKALLAESSGSGRMYHGIRASAPGEAPAERTGALAGSLSVKPSRGGDAVFIRDSAYYALFLEAGAKGGGGKGTRNKRSRGKIVETKTPRVLEPRPFLSRAMDDMRDDLDARIRAAIVDGMEFKQTKKKTS